MTQRKKSLSFLGIAVMAALLAIAPAGAEGRGGQERPDRATGKEAAHGGLTQTVHTHSEPFGSPSGADLLFGTDPLGFPITEGSFRYSSVACEDPAPFNDVALRFHPEYPGVDSPAKVRYLVEGTVTDVSESGDRATVEGTITTILCEGPNLEQEGDRYFVDFEGMLVRTSDNEAQLRGGTFEITGGTGRFQDLSGQGSIKGRFTCLPPVLQRNNAQSCADLGAFSDAIFRLTGSFADPTVDNA